MEWAIYFIGFIGKVSETAEYATIISGIALPLSLLFGPMMLDMLDLYRDEARGILKKVLKYIAIAFCVSGSLYIVIPDSKTLAAMYLIPAIAKNEQVQNITGNSLKALEQLTKKWVQDLMPENEAEKK